MKRKVLLAVQCLLMAFAAATFFTACKEKENVAPEDLPNGNGEREPVVVVMKSAEVSGLVKAANGDFLQGVTILTGTATTTTNKVGLFAFSEVGTVKDRSVMKFSKPGYFTVVRSGVYADDMLMEVVMQPMEDVPGVSTSTTFNAAAGGTLEVGDMKVKIPAGALVTATGEVYTGTVTASVLYLDPNNENFAAMMPGGDMMAVRSDDSEAILISYGMIEVTLTDGADNKLQIKDGAEADLTFPIPAGMENNPPATIPLWHFNEETGLWEETGEATLQGNVYVGAAKHFSWVNCDVPTSRFTVKGKVTGDCDGKPVANVRICVMDDNEVVQYYSYSNNLGEYSVSIPSNYSATVTVLSRDYFNYPNAINYPIAAQNAMTTKIQNIELPCTPYITGKVVNTCGDLIAAYVWYEYTLNGNTVKVSPGWVKTSGEFSIRVPFGTTTGKLWVEDLSGNLISENIATTNVSIDLGNVEICEEYRPEFITITYPTNETINIPLKDSISAYVFSNAFHIYDLIHFVIPKYDSNVEEYNNVHFTLSNGNIYGTATVNIREKDSESYTISMVGSGYEYKESTSTAVTISGTFTVFAAIVDSFDFCPQPSVITGATQVNPGQTGYVYSVSAVAGAFYAWTVPAGWIISGGQGSCSITVTPGTASGSVSVALMSSGCTSAPRVMTVMVTTP
jgi:hypothetical protein